MKKFILALPLLLFASCYQPPISVDLKPYYEESCGLYETSLDSVLSFSGKFSDVTRGMDYSEDPYYQPTLNNIDSAAKVFEITIYVTFEEWGDDVVIEI